MKFDITITTILVFLFPGSIMLVAVLIIAYYNGASFDFIGINVVDIALLGFIGSFFCGVIVDVIRTLFLQPVYTYIIKEWINVAENSNAEMSIPPDSQEELNKDNLSVFSYLIDRTFEYYRLNANATVALAAFFLTSQFVGMYDSWGVLVVLLLVLFFVSGLKACLDMQNRFKRFKP